MRTDSPLVKSIDRIYTRYRDRLDRTTRLRDTGTHTARALEEFANELLDIAADMHAVGWNDPRHLAQADLKALHDVHSSVNDLNRNMHLYLDGRAGRRATAGDDSSPMPKMPM